MKGYMRRALGKPNFYKLALWDAVNCCWRDGSKQYDNEGEAIASIKKPGRYRLSFVRDGWPREDFGEFVVPE